MEKCPPPPAQKWEVFLPPYIVPPIDPLCPLRFRLSHQMLQSFLTIIIARSEYPPLLNQSPEMISALAATAQQTHLHTNRQMHSHTNRQTHLHTNRQTHLHTNRQTHLHTNKHLHTNRQTHLHTNKHTYTLTDKHLHTNRQTHLHTNRQTHLHTNRQTHLHTSLMCMSMATQM